MFVAVLLSLALPAVAQDGMLEGAYIDEELGFLPEASDDGEGPQQVVGGEPVVDGWDDAVGVVFYGAYVGCTGTLIADNVVITAGHCVGGISHVIIGSKDWASDQGEMIAVDYTVEYPDSWRSYDIAVLKLEEKSSYPPRAVAMDCILDDYLDNGADVAVVGYGATNERGTKYTSLLHEGVTQVQTFDCSDNQIDGVWTGCNGSVNPGGEIGAGGNGVDACFGDSGGPLYLLTDEGEYVVGVTSRAYAGVSYNTPCKDGGIYVRPDAVLDWIEEEVGRKVTYPPCNKAPEMTAMTIQARKNGWGQTQILFNDPEGLPATFFGIQEPPENGYAEVDDQGVVTYWPDDGFSGPDTIVVAVTDSGNPEYIETSGAPVTTAVTVTVDVDEKGGGCGCTTSPGALGGWLVVAGGLFVVGRRRS